jgi:Flp pilus assembly protein TadG
MYFRKMLRKFRGWVHNKDGATAIEFSLLAIPYVFLTLGIIELSIMYASASLLEGATNSAARLIKTGQIQTAGGNEEDAFRTALCNYATVLINCNDVVIEALPMNSFSDYDAMQPQMDKNGNMVSQGFNPGGSDAKTLIRVAYRYTMLTPFVGTLLAGPTNSRLFMSTVVLQTEPYQF